jgi:hypothetical protein
MNTSTVRLIHNYPIVLAQVDRLQPVKVFPVDVHAHHSDFGYVTPPERELLITQNVCIFRF